MIITIANHKGGVGKTVITTNLAFTLLGSPKCKSVLVVDMDPQANTSDILCKELNHVKVHVSELLRYTVIENVNFSKPNDKLTVLENMIKEASVTTVMPDQKIITLITSDLSLTKTKIEISSRESFTNFKIREFIKYISKDFDFTLIDTPPSIELLTFASIASSDYILIPIQLDNHAIEGAIDIIDDILPIVNQYYNPATRLLGVVVNTFEERTRIGKLTLQKVREIFGQFLFNTTISRSVRITELGFLKGTVTDIPGSKSYEEFKLLTEELLARIERTKSQ